MALLRMALRDFVIVQQLDIDLHAGFTALTGETGAGKSILIDALQLALGARADASVVREGARQADISAEFDLPEELADWLEHGGFEGGTSLLLRRVIDPQGKSRAWINGSPATATQLRHLGAQLVDIHGQHAWQSLTQPDAVRRLLDAYAQLHDGALRQAWTQWRSAQHALAQARTLQETALRERERLLWQIGEVQKLAPGPQEWDELQAQHTRLSHAHTLQGSATQVLALLEGEGMGARSALVRAQQLLTQQAHLEPRFEPVAQELASSLAQVEDARHALHSYLRHTDLDPQHLQALDERLAAWLAQARRYKCPPAELPQLLLSWQQELQRLDAAADLSPLLAQEQQCARSYHALAQQLSAQRRSAAPRLAQAISAAMQGLGMTGGTFDVRISPCEAGPQGLDAVEFLVASHPGVTPRPVGKVASGGELSRIALAIHVCTSELGQAGTLIFDEVDAGIGGAVAQTVGQLMQRLGRDRQVLAVTHLAQVAACADQHLVVHKQRSTQGTSSSVIPVMHDERVREIARMLGGAHLSATTLAHAREMLGLAASEHAPSAAH